MSYKKPILIEIYTQIYLSKDSFPADRSFELIPKLKELGFTQVELDQSFSLSPELGPQQASITPRVRLWNEGKTQLVQLSKDLLIINLLQGQYPGWDAYMGLLLKVIAVAKTTIGVLSVNSIALHTIDKFSVNKEDYVFDKYLSEGCDHIPKWYAKSKDACDVILGLGAILKDGYNRQLNISVRPDPTKVEIVVQSNFQNRVEAKDQLESILNKLHDESNALFETWITDVTRNQVMGGLK